MERSFKTFSYRLKSIGLRDEIEKRALKQNITLRELYEGPDRAPSVVAARQAIYTWLSTRGKGINEIARIFDRHPSGILKMLRKK